MIYYGRLRDEIEKALATHSKDQLIDALAEKLEKRATSVHPLIEAMFDRIAPKHQPIEYARKADGHREDSKRVAMKSTALKILLHEQIGRPLYMRVLTLKKRDFAECILAVDAYDEGIEQAPGIHVPTTLPFGIDEFILDPPTRTQPSASPFNTIRLV
jgi:hypothetical protein